MEYTSIPDYNDGSFNLYQNELMNFFIFLTKVHPAFILDYAQQMYGQNAGSEYIASSVTLDNAQDAVKKRVGVSVVRDGKTGDMIVKLVNLLPVAVNAKVELPSLEGMNTTAVKTVLAGKPTDQQVRPVSGTIEVSEKFGYELPAYSFTVIRINKNEK